VRILPRQGRPTDSQMAPRGPGVIVMGGNYDVDAAFVWMHDTLVGQGAAGGDVVVLRDPDPRVGHDDDYTAYLLGLAAFNSVQTLVLSGTVSDADARQAVAIIDKAEAVFFGGGDQRDYVGWKGPASMPSSASTEGEGSWGGRARGARCGAAT
jgi:cyanophycinase-like exopeptidase